MNNSIKMNTMFNIYYINFPKAYEIKMMLSNIISTSQEIEKQNSEEAVGELKSKLGFKFWGLFDASVDAGIKEKGADSKKVIETFEVKTTKSIILNDVVEQCKSITSLDDLDEGELIIINDVKLSLENEAELRTIKLFNSGAFKDMAIPGANGFDINNLFNSMFKDYAYKIKGVAINNQEELLIKIPMSFENEFESSYGVDDLFVGKVSILGLYKGKIKIDTLKNSFEFFQEIGNIQNSLIKSTEDDEIQDSQYAIDNKNKNGVFRSSGDNKDYHYIDLIAIIQNIRSIK